MPSSVSAGGKPAVVLYQIRNHHPVDQMNGMEKRAEILLEDALARTSRFDVLDRQTCKPESSDIPLGPEALSLLKGRGLDYLIAGDLTGDDLATEITLKFIRTDSGKIEKSLKAAGITTPHIEPIIRKLYSGLKAAFPLCGRVVRVDADRLVIDLGTKDGVKEGDRFAVLSVSDVKSGNEVIDREERTAATLTIEGTMQEASWGTCLQEGKPVEAGQTVRSLPDAPRKTRPGHSLEETITIKGFENLSGEPSLHHLAQGIAEALTTRLTRSQSLWVVESAQLGKILDEQRLNASSLFDPSTTVATGLLWRARFVIGGSFQKLDELYRVDGRLMDLETSEVVVAESIIGSNVWELTGKLADVFLRRLENKKALKDSRMAGMKVEVQTVDQVPMGIYHLLPVLNAPVIEITLRNETDSKQRLVLSSEIVGFSHPARETVEIEPGKEIVRAQYPALLPGKLKEITSGVNAGFSIQVALMDGRTVHEEIRTVRLLPYDTFVFSQDFIRQRLNLLPTLAAWVSPNMAEAASMLTEASAKNSRQALTGYQVAPFTAERSEALSPEQRKLRTREQVKALYETLKDRGIRYVDQSTQFPSASLQRVLLPDQALKYRSANCIDGAVLLSSLMIRAGLNPIILIVPGHAFIGWETWDAEGEYEVLETTRLGYSNFESAMADARERAREAGLEDNLAGLRFRHGEFRKGKCTVLDIRTLKERMADIPI
jgi:TolB-like protein